MPEQIHKMLYLNLWWSPAMLKIRRCSILTINGNLLSQNTFDAWKVYIVFYYKIGVMKIRAGTERSTCIFIHIIMVSDC